MLALIDTFADESPLVREMAGWVVSGKNDDAIDADTDDNDAAYMDLAEALAGSNRRRGCARLQSQPCCSGGGKDALIRRLGVSASVGALFLCAVATVPHSQRAICANSIGLVLVEPAFGC